MQNEICLDKRNEELYEELYEQYIDQKNIYNLFGKKVVDLIEGLLKNEKIEYQSIDYRVKSNESFCTKVKKKDKYKDIKDITDVCGVRIITYYSDTVDKVAEIISEQFEVDEKNTIDKRKTLDPDKFGYLSLHYVISLKENRLSLPEYQIFKDMKVEIQIRSISQHVWAEIEHDLGYKSDIEVPREIRRDFYRLAGLLELVDSEFVGIRNKLSKYKNDVKTYITDIKSKEEMEAEDKEEIFIDNVSLKLYIEESSNLNEITELISKSLNIKTFKTQKLDRYIMNLIRKLKRLNIDTIEKLDNEIIKNKDNIVEYAKEDKDILTVRAVSNVSSLFDLCSYLNKTNSKNKELDAV